jgi:aspartyl-tRNA(Asn)/glutamyl-tRNA(Gln) amidotransferase subunit C
MIPYRSAVVNPKIRGKNPVFRRVKHECAHAPEATDWKTCAKMPLTSSDVKRIAHLARIEITDTETGQALAQLNDIFGMIERLQSVDTAGIEPMSHPLGGTQRLREDRSGDQVDREAFMRNAPAGQDGLFLVPRVIE